MPQQLTFSNEINKNFNHLISSNSSEDLESLVTIMEGDEPPSIEINH